MQQCQTQSGSVLIVSLIFLLVLTLIGVTAMQGTSLEEKMAGNERSGTLAFQAAEAALRDGENWVMKIDLYNPPTPVSTCSSGTICDLWQMNAFGNYPETKDLSWWLRVGREYGVAGTQEFSGLAADPRYLVEFDRYDPGNTVVDANDRAHQIGPHFYRVTAAGFGPQGTTERVLQTTVRSWKN